jgi:hypothetical protein
VVALDAHVAAGIVVQFTALDVVACCQAREMEPVARLPLTDVDHAVLLPLSVPRT